MDKQDRLKALQARIRQEGGSYRLPITQTRSALRIARHDPSKIGELSEDDFQPLEDYFARLDRSARR